MRGLRRNMTPFYYCLYSDSVKAKDKNGNYTGEQIPIYESAKKMTANISPASGASQAEQFGDLTDYDKVIVTCDTNCPIAESSVLFIDKQPETRKAISYEVEESDALYGENTVTETEYDVPVYDYIVRRVSKSLNSISIAVKKIQVS